MGNRLTKDEWEEKVYRHLVDIEGINIVPLERKFWWFNDGDGMRLSSTGIVRFEQIGIEFQEYDCHVDTWTAAMTIGLSRMPCPYYLSTHKELRRPNYKFCIADNEYAMLLVFMDKNLELFARGFK